MNQEVLIETIDLSKRMGSATVFSNVCVKIEKGSIVLVCASPLVRTAFFRALSLSDMATTGTIKLNGREIFSAVSPNLAMRIVSIKQDIAAEQDADGKKMLKTELNEIRMARAEARVHERLLKRDRKKNPKSYFGEIVVANGRFDLVPARTILENFVFLLNKTRIALPQNIANMALEECNLKEYAHCYPSTLSNSKVALLSVVAALSFKPKVLILDDVFVEDEDAACLEKLLLKAHENCALIFSHALFPNSLKTQIINI